MKNPTKTTSTSPAGSSRHLVLNMGLCFLVFLIFCGGLAVQAAPAADEGQLLSTLQSASSPAEKYAACMDLKRVGTAKAVPVLAQLLTDEKLSLSARYALESIPGAEAGRALMDALGKASRAGTRGQIQTGLIQSLGQRHEMEAAPLLAGLLTSPDANVGAAAAFGLGQIGGTQAVHALWTALPAASTPTQPASTSMQPATTSMRGAILDALLMNAEQLRAGDQNDAAFALFEQIHQADTPVRVRTAAYLGMIRSGGRRELSLVTAALEGKDGPDQSAAIHMVAQIEDPKATKVLSRLLPKLDPALQIGLIGGLGQRGDPRACPALIDMAASDNAEVRVKALAALGQAGDAGSVACLATAAASTNEAEKKAARQSLLNLRDGDVTGMLLKQLKNGQAGVQMEMASALIGRVDKKAVPELLKLAQKGSDSTRKASFRALEQLADPSEIPALVGLILKAKDDKAHEEARGALLAACGRLRESGQRIDTQLIVNELAGAGPRMQPALFQTTTVLADERLRDILRETLKDSNSELREKAIHALAETCDPELLPDLLNLVKDGNDPVQRVLAFRGYVRLATNQGPAQLTPAEQSAAIERILPSAQQNEEKWLVLAGLSKTPDVKALGLAMKMLGDPGCQAEAAQTIMGIANGLKDQSPETAREAIKKALDVSADPKLQEPARAILDAISRNQTAVAAKPAEGGAPLLPSPINLRRQQLDAHFRSEGVAVADFDKDGHLDIATGNTIYSGPDWKSSPMRESVKPYDPENYSQEFLCFAEDIDQDGWRDLIVVGFPGMQTRWLKNPGKRDAVWKEYVAIGHTGNESPVWIDLFKDGKKELVFTSAKGMAYARPDSDPTKEWPIHVIAGLSDPKPGHGLGIGDINGDKRNDILCPDGWWEGPADRKQTSWEFHKVKLSENSAQMVVCDVNGDGLADVVSSSAHGYGVWWYEQTSQGEWIPQEIDRSISETHALQMTDLNGDGLLDIVTGKRFWAHRHEAGVEEPAVLCWYELQRNNGQVSWVRHNIDSDSGVGLHFQVLDLNGDGLLDIVNSNKKGVYAFIQEKEKH